MGKSSVHVAVKGRVQGVGFRFFVLARAQAHGLSGWVRNLPNGQVEACAEGPKTALLQWVDALRNGPPLSRVDDVRADWDVRVENTEGFEIR
jgi:acylphosphatase